MAGVAALNAFSIVLGVATMIPFLGTMLPGREPLVTTVRIYAGTGDNTDGAAPNVAAFDIDGNLIGSVKGGDIVAKGAPYDAKIEMDADGGNGASAQAQYISLSQQGGDAICIAGITVTWPDSLQFAWYGDVGYHCGAPWYVSSTVLSSQDLYTPKCVWIDGDESGGIKTKGISMHLPSFVATAERAQSMTDDKDLWCKVQPRLWFHDNLAREQAIPYFDPHAEFEEGTLLDKDPAKTKDSANWKTKEWALDKKGKKDDKRDADVDGNVDNRNATRIPTQQRFKGHLVKSGQKHHSAKELCESQTSMGPDFVSKEEGFFCDMDAKKAWPLCTEQITSSCFDTTENRMRGGRNNSRRDDLTGERIVRKRYERVDEW